LMGYILDRTEKYFRIRWSRKIKRKLKKYNWSKLITCLAYL
jgi:hypothetical protein